MHSFARTTLLSGVLLAGRCLAGPPKVSELLDNYGAGQDLQSSWVLSFESAQRHESHAKRGAIEVRNSKCSMRFDEERAFLQWHSWGGAEGTANFLPREKARYLSLLWDGQAFSSYRSGWGDPNGVLVIYTRGNPYEADAVRYEHIGAPLFGYYLNVHKRVDQVLRDASTITLREEPEDVNGVQCYAIDARTKYGDYTVWMDPVHGYNIAKATVLMSQANKHTYNGRPIRGERTFRLDVLRFERASDAWVPTEVVWEMSQVEPGRPENRGTTQVTVTDIILNPAHDALGSFVRNDVKEGAWGWMAPAAHIRYRWHAGAFVPEFDGQIIDFIDKRVQTILDEQIETPDANTPSNEKAGSPRPRRPKPFCGLYCTYAALRLSGMDIDFSDLIKPEYFGTQDGSSLLELRKAAVDHGLHAEPAARLSALTLRHCPYRAILHVRSSPESSKYDHYEMFMGTENGKAKLFNPPEEPRLVSFADLATQWDGKVLLVSDRPVDLDLVLAADRQRLLWYGMAGVLVIVVFHFGKRLWFSLVPALPRRWTLFLTASQAAALGLAAVFCGGFYQFASEGGLLANGAATQSFQKGHIASFIPKVGERRVRKLLGTETVFIDARLTRDYKLGHLDSAISLPIDANDVLWKATTAKIPRNARIVAYCQSAGCKFAQTVSLRLIEEGYWDISIFKGGWAEWTARHGRAQPPQSTGKEVKSKDADQNDRT